MQKDDFKVEDVLSVKRAIKKDSERLFRMRNVGITGRVFRRGVTVTDE